MRLQADAVTGPEVVPAPNTAGALLRRRERRFPHRASMGFIVTTIEELT
jgi:hypothetical protein